MTHPANPLSAWASPSYPGETEGVTTGDEGREEGRPIELAPSCPRHLRSGLHPGALSAHHAVEQLSGKGRFETLPWLAARSPTCGLAQIAPVDLHIPVLGQLAATQLALSDALEPGPLEVVRFNGPLGSGPLRQ
jgi:hypothetical protein